MSTETKETDVLSLAEELGFEKATQNLDAAKKLRDRLAPIYEHYRYATQQSIERFQQKLKRTTGVDEGRAGAHHWVQYDTLVFFSVSDYPEVPPASVLLALKEARETGHFDTFEIAKVETVRVDLDPILFGRVNGCTDRFFICQWGEDVKFEDLVGKNGG